MVTENYDPRGDDRIRSNVSLENDRPPSPLIPSQVSNSSEKPTYEAHRDSMNLQHPQPRVGTTARYQNHLESQVRTVSSPVSPESDQFGSNPILSRFGQGRRGSGGGHLSPISDDGYHGSQDAPPLPPKVRDDGPLVPSQAGSSLERNATFAERTAPTNQSGQVCNCCDYELSSTRYATDLIFQPPPGQRRLNGPRPITTSGNYSPLTAAGITKTRYRGSPNPMPSDDDDGTF